MPGVHSWPTSEAVDPSQQAKVVPGDGFPRRYQSEILVACCLALAALAVYSHGLENDFVFFDDNVYVNENQHVRGGWSVPNFVYAWTTFELGNWHPLTWLSLQTDAQFHGVDPWWFHLHNDLLHAANAVLLFLALRRMTGVLWRSAFVAAFFVVHPLHVESVEWVAERKDVLSGLFWMLSLLAYCWYADRPGVGRYLLVALAFSLGLLAKPMLVTLPCVLLLLDYWPLGRWSRGTAPAAGERPRLSATRLIAEKVPLLALSALLCVLTWYAQRGSLAIKSLQAYPPGVRVANALVAYVVYLRKMVWPVDLAVFYAHPGLKLPLWKAVAAGALLAGITAAVFALRRRRPYLVVGWFWYLGTLVPVIGIVQVGFQALADRYTYIPLIGIYLAVTWGVADLAGRLQAAKVAAAAAGFLMLFACAACTWVQEESWRNPITLWEHAVKVCEDKAGVANNLAVFLQIKDDPRAEKAARAAVKLDPHSTSALYNLALVLQKKRQPENAEEVVLRLLKVDPRFSPGLRLYGELLFERGEVDAAIAQYRAALEGDPDRPQTRLRLGEALTARGDYAEAVAELRRAAELQPNRAEVHTSLAYALYYSGEPEAGRREYEKARQLDPRTIGVWKPWPPPEPRKAGKKS